MIKDSIQYKTYMAGNPEIKISPEYLSVLTLVIAFLAFIKTVLILRIFPGFQQIIRLSSKVFFASFAFSFFFYALIMFFAYGY